MASGSYVQGVKLLVDSGVVVIPEAYVKPVEQRYLEPDVQSVHSIPVIDLAGLRNERRFRTVQDMRLAAQDWGFFQVINHGIPMSLLESMQRVAHEFFELPAEEKMKYYSSSLSSRPTVYGSSFNPYLESTHDWRDFLRHSCSPLSKDNISSWPLDPPAYRDTGVTYCELVARLCEDLLSALSEALDLESEALKKSFGGSEQFLLLNYYPACPQPELALGLSSHSDVGGITVLLQDNLVSGLQVLHEDKWISVKPRPGALVVNIADQLQVLSNRSFKSVEHRVVLNSEADRLSVAFFYSPALDTLVAPLEELLDERHPALYKKYSFKKYKQCFYSRPLGSKSILASFQT